MIINLPKKYVKQAASLVLHRYRCKTPILLLWMLLLAIGQQAWAQDNELTNMSRNTAIHNTDGSVTFKILFYDDEDEDEFVKEGKVHTEKDNDKIQILYFESWVQGLKTNYAATVTPKKGTCVFTDYNGTEYVVKQGDTKEITFAREENRYAYIQFKWYYTNEFEGNHLRFQLDETNDHADDVKGQPFGDLVSVSAVLH